MFKIRVMSKTKYWDWLPYGICQILDGVVTLLTLGLITSGFTLKYVSWLARYRINH